MADTDQTNAMDGAKQVANHPIELEQAQIICVIGKVPFTPVHFLIDRLLMDDLSGGPGVGKGTQCKRLVADLGISHLSVGDLLRDRASKVLANTGLDIMACMRDGKLVPKETVQSVLEDELVANVKAGRNRILLDGFPRSMEQTELFEGGVSAEPSFFSIEGCSKKHGWEC